MQLSTFTTKLQKQEAMESKKYRTINIMSKLGEVVLSVILNGVRSQARPGLTKEHNGFV